MARPDRQALDKRHFARRARRLATLVDGAEKARLYDLAEQLERESAELELGPRKTDSMDSDGGDEGGFLSASL